jgi:hypothetical protein
LAKLHQPLLANALPQQAVKLWVKAIGMMMMAGGKED